MMRPTITILLTMIATAASAADLTGRARPVDGDTIRIGETSIRIWGLAAPEQHQPGGYDAAAAMSIIVARGPVTCWDTGRRSHGRVVGWCRVGGEDIAEIMVSNGFARDCPAYSGGRYARHETDDGRRLVLPGYCGVKR